MFPKLSISFTKIYWYTYTKEGSALVGKKFHEMPLILSGDFNVNFADDLSKPLIDFSREKLDLEMSNNKNVSTTRYGTTIDAVFTRRLERFRSEVYVCYFSYHKPIISVSSFHDHANPMISDE